MIRPQDKEKRNNGRIIHQKVKRKCKKWDRGPVNAKRLTHHHSHIKRKTLGTYWWWVSNRANGLSFSLISFSLFLVHGLTHKETRNWPWTRTRKKKKENVRNDFLLSFYYLSGRLISTFNIFLFVRIPPRININDNNVVSFLMCVQEHAVDEIQSLRDQPMAAACSHT